MPTAFYCMGENQEMAFSSSAFHLGVRVATCLGPVSSGKKKKKRGGGKNILSFHSFHGEWQDARNGDKA